MMRRICAMDIQVEAEYADDESSESSNAINSETKEPADDDEASVITKKRKFTKPETNRVVLEDAANLLSGLWRGYEVDAPDCLHCHKHWC
jgi:hypothetical protein